MTNSSKKSASPSGGDAAKKSSGSNLTEGVSSLEKCGGCGDMYTPTEKTQRMPKGHDRI